MGSLVVAHTELIMLLLAGSDRLARIVLLTKLVLWWCELGVLGGALLLVVVVVVDGAEGEGGRLHLQTSLEMMVNYLSGR